MSATNRSLVRLADDYYRTPLSTIDEFLNEFLNIAELYDDFKILDPCCGGDIYNLPSYPNRLQRRGFNDITEIDIRSESRCFIIDDYLEHNNNKKYDLIISNPPYSLAMDFIIKGFKDLKEGGYLVYLLRLNYFGAQKRKQFWKDNMPSYCFVHSKRPSFTKGGTDASEYCHMVWIKGKNPEYCQLKVI